MKYLGNNNKSILKGAALLGVALCLVSCGTQKNSSAGSSINSNVSDNSVINSSASSNISSQSTVLEHVDYVDQLKLDMTSNTIKKQVTVKTYIDGDTTHFNMPDNSYPLGAVIKARYLAVNTPESTGLIEAWGKKASKFTHETLASAESIMIESDNDQYNLDSTGGRCLLWVWYRKTATSDYRCLNLELLQEGYAIASNSADNRYGAICMKAIAQAKAEKLRIYDPEGDRDFYVGGPQELTLKELRCHMTKYDGTKVSFTGVVTKLYNNGVYIEEYDDSIEQYCGMYVYYGFNTNGNVMAALTPGNEVRVVGTVSSFNGTYQVSGLEYDMWEPEKNTYKISDGHEASYAKVSAADFNATKSVEFEIEDPETGESTITNEDHTYAELACNTTISMDGLHVDRVYTTESENEDSDGAMTLTCSVGQSSVTVRTIVLKDSSGKLITEDAYLNKTINVKGVVDCFNGSYQIKVFQTPDITVIQ